MAPEEQSFLLRIPCEIRLMIYQLLLDDCGQSSFEIRSEPVEKYRRREKHRRTSYRILGAGMVRQTLKVTYHLASSARLHTNILATNKRIYGEASHLLYGKHSFDFGRDIEAIVPFLSDLTPQTRHLIWKISLTKQGSIYCREFDRWEWSSVCSFIAENLKIRQLVLRVMGIQAPREWPMEGVQQYTISDFRTLASVGFEGLEWVRDLRRITSLEDLEIIPTLVSCPPVRSSTAMAFYTAFSRSIDKGFQDYLRAEMLPKQ